jgi:hypothetical protein
MIGRVRRTQTARRRQLSCGTIAVPQVQQDAETARVGQAAEQLGVKVK